MQKANVNGLNIAYSRVGKGPALVLIHGYPLDHSIWDPIVPLLQDSFDLIVPDMRGFGESGSTDRTYGVEDLAADVAGLLDALGIQEAALVGHSMGGYVALAFARTFPARIRGLGLVASQVLPDTPERKDGRYKSAVEVSEKGVDGIADAMTPKLTADPKLQALVRPLILKQSRSGVVGALKAMAERPDSTGLIKDFQLPLVVVHGGADALIPIDRAREVDAAVMQTRLFELENTGHMPMLEAPQQTAEALKYLA